MSTSVPHKINMVVYHNVGLAILHLKISLMPKKELWKLKNISPCKNIIFQKINPLKENKRKQNPSRY